MIEKISMKRIKKNHHGILAMIKTIYNYESIKINAKTLYYIV